MSVSVCESQTGLLSFLVLQTQVWMTYAGLIATDIESCSVVFHPRMRLAGRHRCQCAQLDPLRKFRDSEVFVPPTMMYEMGWSWPRTGEVKG